MSPPPRPFPLSFFLSILAGFLLLGNSVRAAGSETKDLRARISQTLEQRKYSVLLPDNQKHVDAIARTGPLAAIGRWALQVGESFHRGIRTFGHWLQRILLSRKNVERAQPKLAKPTSLLHLWWLVVLGVLAIAGALALLLLRARPTLQAQRASNDIRPVPPVADEQTLATALPEAEWLRLAEQLLQTGERRLAVRALHLAGLAILSQQGFLNITAYKTTADYRADLNRRARGTAIPEIFARNSRRYESTWYGLHEASQDLVQQFQSDLQALHELSHA